MSSGWIFDEIVMNSYRNKAEKKKPDSYKAILQ